MVGERSGKAAKSSSGLVSALLLRADGRAGAPDVASCRTTTTTDGGSAMTTPPITALITGFASAFLLLSGPAAAAPPATATIASATAVGLRAVVTATRASDGGAPSATVNVTAYEHTGSGWKSLGRVRVGRVGGFFWKVLRGPRSIKRFSIATASPERVALQLLVTPSIGWSPVYRFHVANGRLAKG
jgi:hypothetical protein